MSENLLLYLLLFNLVLNGLFDRHVRLIAILIRLLAPRITRVGVVTLHACRVAVPLHVVRVA